MKILTIVLVVIGLLVVLYFLAKFFLRIPGFDTFIILFVVISFISLVYFVNKAYKEFEG